MNRRRRCQNGRKLSFNHRITFGLCAVAIATTPVNTHTVANATPAAKTQQVMVEAINDEYRARAFYSAVIEKFGNVRPFSNIVQAEDRHVQLWNTLFTK